jgi:hypothetical protein
MATIDAYGARFIGNDLVTPKVKPRVSVEPHRYRRSVVAVPTVRVPQVQPAEVAIAEVERRESFSTPVSAARRMRSGHQLPVRQMTLIVLSTVTVLGVSLFAVPRFTGVVHAADIDTSRLALGIKDKMHPTSQGGFVMPANSVLVKNSVLSSYIDAIESQSVEINIGSNAVTPLPTDIANWIKTSAGPEKGTTLISANVPNITSYVTSAIQSSTATQQSTALSGDGGTSSAKVAAQIAQTLLKYNGVTVTVPNIASSAQAN